MRKKTEEGLMMKKRKKGKDQSEKVERQKEGQSGLDPFPWGRLGEEVHRHHRHPVFEEEC